MAGPASHYMISIIPGPPCTFLYSSHVPAICNLHIFDFFVFSADLVHIETVASFFTYLAIILFSVKIFSTHTCSEFYYQFEYSSIY